MKKIQSKKTIAIILLLTILISIFAINITALTEDDFDESFDYTEYETDSLYTYAVVIQKIDGYYYLYTSKYPIYVKESTTPDLYQLSVYKQSYHMGSKLGEADYYFYNYSFSSTDYHIFTTPTYAVSQIIWSNHDIKTLDSSNVPTDTVFFSKPLEGLLGIVQKTPLNPLQQVLMIVPICLTLLVSLLGFRKAYGWLLKILKHG